eukprot:comp22625_c0_seq1/m.34770 comp22625_c0_seq1/g.34770  ORF comp22625_c0_seq1/g.34770 comp22625_c0_seq1/m.34770 type:complete len:874 (-) comp22625_c0_seq1:42-2663(-)
MTATDAPTAQPHKAGAKEKTKVEDVDDLSEEDRQLKEDLEMLVERLQEGKEELYGAALEQLRTIIRSSTSSMTSVPKPLKFLRPHYDTLKQTHARITNQADKHLAADVVSVLAMTMGEKPLECLRYRLIGTTDNVGSWGHEYVRHLSAEIGQAYNDKEEEEGVDKLPTDRLGALAEEIVPYCMRHNAEAEACDLLMEIERLDLLEKCVEKDDYPRVCLYLVSCVNYVPEPEDTQLLRTALNIFRKFDQRVEAMRLASRLNDQDLVQEIFDSCADIALKKQMAFILARQQGTVLTDSEEIQEILANAHLNANFLALARDLDIMDPKVPEDIYKTHLEPTRSSTFGGSNVDSARQNLASTFVNAFVNCGFGQDKLMTLEGNKWLYKNKDHGMMSAAASLGMVLLWDVDGGLTQIDKFLYSNEDYIKAGALLACGVVNSGVRNECDPALALLADYVLHNSNTMRVGAIMGLGIAYAGSNREDLIELLVPVLSDSKSNMEVLGVAAVALGLVCVGSARGDVAQALLDCMMARTEAQLTETHVTYLGLGLALIFLARQEAADVFKEALKVLPKALQDPAAVLLDICAYAGTGNVLKVQNLLHMCSEHVDKEKDQDDRYQAVAVLGLALISMGEEIGAEMALRSFNHLLQYGEEGIRRAVPLALGLLCASNPRLSVLDTLSKLSHDADQEVAHNSIMALGIVGCGTNNARIAAMLRQLAVYYHKDPNNLFVTRVAQGLLHMGKGTMSVSPYHSDRTQMSNVATAGLVAVLVALLDVKNTILGKSHYLLYFLAPAVYPRMLTTFDENLQPLQVSVRVGQAVDVVGQAGKPKTITGFQTHTTPVLLAYGERAELATEEYIPLAPTLEGFVILRKNPNFNEE